MNAASITIQLVTTPVLSGGWRHPAWETAAIDTTVSGSFLSEFAPVVGEFAANFAERGEVGGALCVIQRGEVLIDVWGGSADAAGERPWTGDTMANFYSAGKAVIAALVLRAMGGAGVELDTPLVEFWPEFGEGGKEWVTIRLALSHRAAVPAIRGSLTDRDLFDWDTMTSALAATAPWWDEGARHAYHTNTYGHLTGEIVRRLTGRSPGAALREVADEIGADIWFGVPADEQLRCAEVIWAADPPRLPDPSTLAGDAQMNVLAHFNPPGYSSVGVQNTAAWRSCELPSTAGHGTARGLARFYLALLEPGRILEPDLLALATRPHSIGPCPILADDVTFGLGFTPTTARRPLGPNLNSFGHFGTGGALGFADPDAGIAFGYVMNHVIPRWQSTRNRALIDRLYEVL